MQPVMFILLNAQVLNIGISSDVLYSPDEQKEISKFIKNARYEEIESVHGHDAFLIEFEKMSHIISSFLRD